MNKQGNEVMGSKEISYVALLLPAEAFNVREQAAPSSSRSNGTRRRHRRDDVGEADVILASSSELKQNPSIRRVAKLHKLPIFVIKSTTMAQMVKAVRMIVEKESFGSASITIEKPSVDDIEIKDDAPESKPSLEELDALEEVRVAIESIVIPGGDRQLELVESYHLAVENLGTHLNPRLQILPRRSTKKRCHRHHQRKQQMIAWGIQLLVYTFLKD